MTKRFKLVLFIRFFGYFVFSIGLLSFLAVFGPLVKAEFGYRWDNIRGIKRSVPLVITSSGSEASLSASSVPAAGFGQIKTSAEVITPLSTDFGIVIEKINANAKIIANVNPANEREYVSALTKGVAHAAGTKFPGEKGNIYLFSHSTDAPWNVIRYNAVFYLLRELEVGDRVILFYNYRRFDYFVYDKTIVNPTDVSFLTNQYDESILTLQTCDPPGTLLKRLVIRAKLSGS